MAAQLYLRLEGGRRCLQGFHNLRRDFERVQSGLVLKNLASHHEFTGTGLLNQLPQTAFERFGRPHHRAGKLVGDRGFFLK